METGDGGGEQEGDGGLRGEAGEGEEEGGRRRRRKGRESRTGGCK